MTRQLFIQNKSLSFQIKRFVYDDLRYKQTCFVHRKTLINNLFIFNNSYFYILWRFFYIQDKYECLTHEDDVKIVKNSSFKIYNSFIQNFLNTKHIKKHVSKNTLNYFDNPNSEKLTELLFTSKQNITELFYMCPLNIENKDTYNALQKLFMNKTNVIQDLFETENVETFNNYNFYDIGVVSKILYDDDIKKDELFNFINTNCNKSLPITDGLYKTIVWNILNNGIKQNKNFLLKLI